MTRTAELVRQMYAAYNGRDAERSLALLTDDVDWLDGAARMHGKDRVRDYWLRQWTRLDTNTSPLSWATGSMRYVVCGMRRPNGTDTGRIARV